MKNFPSDSVKWNTYPEDVLPMWVADMDFPISTGILTHLKERVSSGLFGYSLVSSELLQIISARLFDKYSFKTQPEQIIFMPGHVASINVAALAFLEKNEAAITMTPAYPHFFKDPLTWERRIVDIPLIESATGYQIDFDRLTKSLTPEIKMVYFCNPHNPVGRVYELTELKALADFVCKNNLILISDEIHCDLIMPGFKHIPIASLGAEIEERTVTFMSASKAFNLSGFGLGYVIIKNEKLRSQWQQKIAGLLPGTNPLSQIATSFAYKTAEPWLKEKLLIIYSNYQILDNFFKSNIAHIKLAALQGTYLAWADCRSLNSKRPPAQLFLQNGVAVMDGEIFGSSGRGFVRINLACEPETLKEACARFLQAAKSIKI